MTKLCIHIMAEVECWKTLNKSVVLLPVLTHMFEIVILLMSLMNLYSLLQQFSSIVILFSRKMLKA